MILDEAQNIKNSSSVRWKTLLSFHCRNRLLLTGTPIQNNMQGANKILVSFFHSFDRRIVGTAPFHYAQLVRLA